VDSTAASPASLAINRRLFWSLQLLGWAALVGALVLPWIGRYPLGWMLGRKLPFVLFGIAATLGLQWVYRALTHRGWPFWLVLAASLPASWLGARLWAAAVDAATPLTGLAARSEDAFLRLSIEQLNSPAYYALVLLAWSLLYIGIQHGLALQQSRLQQLRAEALAQRARLQALRYQLQPHFLFNTLNAASTLVVEQRSEEAVRLLARLADFLRATLREATGDQTTLRDEVEFARQYLEIERVRFGERLDVSWNIPASLESALVPPLILQPLVENSVRHAIAPSERGAHIRIAAIEHGQRLVLTVIDDGPGLPDAPGRSGIGLANTRARLEQLYGAAHSLTLSSAPGGGLLVRIELPLARSRDRSEPVSESSAVTVRS